MGTEGEKQDGGGGGGGRGPGEGGPPNGDCMSSATSHKRAPSLKKSSRMNSHEFETVRPDQKVLTPDEKVIIVLQPTRKRERYGSFH